MGKYARDTKGLSLLEHGAYTLLLDEYYSNGPLPIGNAGSNATLMPDHSRLHRICSATSRAEQDAVDSVLKMKFFVIDGFYHNKKADEVIEEQQKKHLRRVEAGKKGAQAMLKQCSSNAPQTKTKRKKEDTSVSSSEPSLLADTDGVEPPIPEIDMEFQKIWHVYPSRGKDGARGAGYKGPRQAAFKSFTRIYKNAKENEREAIVRNITEGCGKYEKHLDRSGYPSKHAATWLNQRGWEDDYSGSGASGGSGWSGGRQSKSERARDALLRSAEDLGITGRPDGET